MVGHTSLGQRHNCNVTAYQQSSENDHQKQVCMLEEKPLRNTSILRDGRETLHVRLKSDGKTPAVVENQGENFVKCSDNSTSEANKGQNTEVSNLIFKLPYK